MQSEQSHTASSAGEGSPGEFSAADKIGRVISHIHLPRLGPHFTPFDLAGKLRLTYGIVLVLVVVLGLWISRTSMSMSTMCQDIKGQFPWLGAMKRGFCSRLILRPW